MKRTIKTLILSGIIVFGSLFSIASAQSMSSRNSKNNNVPDYYYANYKFVDDWEAIIDWFTEAKSKYAIGQQVTSSEFSELSKHFDVVFPNLIEDYESVYQKCSLLAKELENNYSKSTMESLLGNACYKSLRQAISIMNSSYRVIPSVSISSNGGMAPLTVTFNAIGSYDPSQETIPTDNFYRYYRDEKGVDTPIGEGQTLSYTFEEPGKFIIHMVARSSNVDEGILDGERNLTITVSPKAADIVVYANTRKMTSGVPLKIGISEGEKGVVFDGSLTVPRGGRKILKHRWVVENNSKTYYDSKYKDGEPSYINIPLKGKGTFKVKLMTLDNENNEVSKSFYVYLSDPVTVIKQTPSEGTTSTTFSFDGSASYSITNRLSSYIWEVFDGNGGDSNGERIYQAQGKKINYKFKKPGNYIVRLTVTDMAGNQNEETRNIYVESTTPTPQFTAKSTNKWKYPSEFILDASNTTDVDVDNKLDSLEYKRYFSTDKVKIITGDNDNKRVVVQFDEKGKQSVRLMVTDQYGKIANITKSIDINSILRPELEIIPQTTTWGQFVQFNSTVNSKIFNYSRDFGDKKGQDGEHVTRPNHRYSSKGVYLVNLTVTNTGGDINTVQDKVFVGEIDSPIATYKVMNNLGYYISASDVCKIADGEGGYSEESAYPVDRSTFFTINASTSVNTKGTSQGLQYVFEKEPVGGVQQIRQVKQLKESFYESGCHYIDLVVTDLNIGKQDRTRIWFNVKNALPTIRNVTLSYPQYTDGNNSMRFIRDSNSNKSTFDCSGTSNLTVKVTAVDPKDIDGNISRLKFFYYNVDDPGRKLEYKEGRLTSPYVYFSIPRIAGEYKFGVRIYDNDGGYIDSDDYLASDPSVYFPAVCGDTDIPSVTLRESSTNVQVGDTVTFTIISKISVDTEDFETDRTFYYDFTGDGIRDVVTKKDTMDFTFEESYEDGITPRAAVEYRGKFGKAEGATMLVRNGIKPILLYNVIGNTVVFRDMSIGIMQKRQVCFEDKECKDGNTRYRKTHMVSISGELLTGGSETPITKNDTFLFKYDEEGLHNVSIYFKNKYGIEVETGFIVKTDSNKKNGQIASGINMITIPETTFTNGTPEIFLNKQMRNILVMYINNEKGETCFVDTDISKDSDGDGKQDNDRDLECNKIVKIKYEPNYDNAIGRLYFTNNGKLTFKNFYVSFQGYISELDEEKMEIYKDITTLINGIEDTNHENTDLKQFLDRLRKNLNNRPEVTNLVLSIKGLIIDGGIKIDLKQKELLDYIISRLENEDTDISSVGFDEYEKNKAEILATLTTETGSAIKSTIEEKFKGFEENLHSYNAEERAKELGKIWDKIIDDGKKNKWLYDERAFDVYFCNIFEYYDILQYTTKCSNGVEPSINENYNEGILDSEINSDEGGGFPTWLKIILIILVCGLLLMGGIIVFFSIKARMNRGDEEDEG